MFSVAEGVVVQVDLALSEFASRSCDAGSTYNVSRHATDFRPRVLWNVFLYPLFSRKSDHFLPCPPTTPPFLTSPAVPTAYFLPLLKMPPTIAC
ncbi:hypothetical protein Pla52o_30520 [Novipirellula galeiformis]|uniref:Uncharacterized protein n=1 Tax=Novipirellula galeiformis TaxID=2528004 RepID=A0A5C6CER6_9BACT|nr:hypothetical protein Pla52o_30520 [Novipirellula galeiformis]